MNIYLITAILWTIVGIAQIVSYSAGNIPTQFSVTCMAIAIIFYSWGFWITNTKK